MAKSLLQVTFKRLTLDMDVAIIGKVIPIFIYPITFIIVLVIGSWESLNVLFKSGYKFLMIFNGDWDRSDLGWLFGNQPVNFFDPFLMFSFASFFDFDCESPDSKLQSFSGFLFCPLSLILIVLIFFSSFFRVFNFTFHDCMIASSLNISNKV